MAAKLAEISLSLDNYSALLIAPKLKRKCENESDGWAGEIEMIELRSQALAQLGLGHETKTQRYYEWKPLKRIRWRASCQRWNMHRSFVEPSSVRVISVGHARPRHRASVLF